MNLDWRHSYFFIGSLCSKKRFYSAFNFPAILEHRMGLCCIDVKLVNGKAAVSLRLPPALKWKSISGYIWYNHCLWPPHFNLVCLWFEGEFNALCRTIKCEMGMLPALSQGDKKETDPPRDLNPQQQHCGAHILHSRSWPSRGLARDH